MTTVTARSPSGADPHLVEPGRLNAARASVEFVSRIPHEFARSHLILSQGCESSDSNDVVEVLAVGPDTSACAVHNVGARLGRNTRRRVDDGEQLARAIDQAYANVPSEASALFEPSDAPNGIEAELSAIARNGDQNLLATHGKGPVVRLVDLLLFDALGRAASDVHIHPHAGRTLVRYRVDGVLHTVRELPAAATTAVLSRIKVMGRMDIAECRLPQDGRATVAIGSESGPDAVGRSIDLRISTLPTSYGERAVIRLLDNSNQLCDLDRLGMTPEMAAPYLERAGRTNG